MVTGPNPGATYGSDISWHVDPLNLRLINPKGAVKEGLNIDGVLPDDMRRNGSFSNPPPTSSTSYHWEALQGIVSGARILERIDPGLSIWETGDQAILRAVTLLESEWRRDYNTGGSNWAAIGDDAWMLPFIDAAYGTDFTGIRQSPAGCGNMVKMPDGAMSLDSKLVKDFLKFSNYEKKRMDFMFDPVLSGRLQGEQEKSGKNGE